MNKSELIKSVASKSKLSVTDASSAIEGFIDTVIEAMERGEDVKLVGFGAFTIIERKTRTGYNPSTGGTMIIPAKKQVKFKSGYRMILK